MRLSSSQPSRILAVTGIFTWLDHARARVRAVRASSVIIAEPPPTRQTLRTGQPILTSTAATPRDSSRRRRIAHFLRDRTEELDGQGLVGGPGFDELQGLGIAFEQASGH